MSCIDWLHEEASSAEEKSLAERVLEHCREDLDLAPVEIRWHGAKAFRNEAVGGEIREGDPGIIHLRAGLDPRLLVYLVAHESYHLKQFGWGEDLLGFVGGPREDLEAEAGNG